MLKVRKLPGLVLAIMSHASVLAQVQRLPSVVIEDEAERYVQSSTSEALRGAVPIEQVPQSVLIVGRKLMEDQAAGTVSDAVRNLSNVRTVDVRDFNNEQLRVRGFRAATTVDGVAMPIQFANLESTVNVDRIEVIKGPAPATSGGSQAAGAFGFVGGTVAIRTKSPQADPSREVGVRLGSRSERGLHFDLNQPVSDVLGLRIVGETYRAGSEVDAVTFHRTGIFPSLSLRPMPGSELSIKLRSTRRSTLDYSGLPPEGTVLAAAFTVPRSLNIRAVGQPDSTSDTDGVSVQWTHKLAQDWSYTLAWNQTRSRMSQTGVFTDDFFAPNPGPLYLLTGLNLTEAVRSSGLSASLQGDVPVAGLTHKVAVGLDLDRTRDYGYFGLAGGFPGIVGFYDITAPVLPAWVEAVPNLAGAQDNRYSSRALYLQDRVSIGGRLHLLASLRHTRIQVDNTVGSLFLPASVFNRTSHAKTSPRVGATYEFTPQLSAFAGYGEGMTVPTNGVYTTPPRPEESRQSELGLRLRALAGWTATIAWFDLRRSNVPVPDPATPGSSIQIGEQRSRGIDIDFTYEASRALTLLGHFTQQSPTVTQDTTVPSLVGHQLFNVARRSGRLGMRFEPWDGSLKGLGLGIGATYHGRLPGNLANSFFTPSATVWDAQLSWRAAPVTWTLAIANLTDRQYFQPSAYFGGGHVMPAPRRQLSLGATIQF